MAVKKRSDAAMCRASSWCVGVSGGRRRIVLFWTTKGSWASCRRQVSHGVMEMRLGAVCVSVVEPRRQGERDLGAEGRLEASLVSFP